MFEDKGSDPSSHQKNLKLEGDKGAAPKSPWGLPPCPPPISNSVSCSVCYSERLGVDRFQSTGSSLDIYAKQTPTDGLSKQVETCVHSRLQSDGKMGTPRAHFVCEYSLRFL